MQTPKEVITIRRSMAVIGQFNLYLEKGAARCRLATGMNEAEALQRGLKYSKLLQIAFERHTLELNKGIL